jgi:hypothetical protein
VLDSAASSITFSSIPGTYNHLQLVAMARSATASAADNWALQVNGDTGAHYDRMDIYVNGFNTSGSSSTSAQTSWSAASADLPAASDTAGYAGLLKVEIPAYALTTFNKVGTWRSGNGDTFDSTSTVHSISLGWRSTAAVTSMKLFLTSGGNLATGSAAYLYGVT